MVLENLWSILTKNGIHGKKYRAVTSKYDVVKVRPGGDLTDCFVCPLGMKQGEVSSPVLFSLFINHIQAVYMILAENV